MFYSTAMYSGTISRNLLVVKTAHITLVCMFITIFMRALIAICAVVVLAGCINTTTVYSTSNSVITAQPYLGLEERLHRHEIRNLIGVDPVRTEWCAAFVNAILEKDSIPNLYDIGSSTPLLARQFLLWGNTVNASDIQRGDVVVFPRGNQGWQGHVGFYVETEIVDGVEYWVILGGNQDQSISYALFTADARLGIRRWMHTD